MATKWFALKKTRGISDVHADDIWKSLEKDVFPAIGQTLGHGTEGAHPDCGA
ncbi:phage integrase central domain-containing protein [Escherichia coli]